MAAATRLAVVLDSQPRPDWEIAVYCGLHPSVISRYRSGTRDMPLRHATRLAEHLDVPVDDVIGTADDTWLAGRQLETAT